MTPTNKVDERVSVGVREYLGVIALEIALLNVVNVSKLVLNQKSAFSYREGLVSVILPVKENIDQLHDEFMLA